MGGDIQAALPEDGKEQDWQAVSGEVAAPTQPFHCEGRVDLG